MAGARFFVSVRRPVSGCVRILLLGVGRLCEEPDERRADERRGYPPGLHTERPPLTDRQVYASSLSQSLGRIEPPDRIAVCSSKGEQSSSPAARLASAARLSTRLSLPADERSSSTSRTTSEAQKRSSTGRTC